MSNHYAHLGYATNDPQTEFMTIANMIADFKQRYGKPQTSFESEMLERLDEAYIRAWRMASRLEEEANRFSK